MNKIDFPRLSYDGSSITEVDLVTKYTGWIEQDIRERVKKIRPRDPRCKVAKQIIVKNIHDILSASPYKLSVYARYVDIFYPNCFSYLNKRHKISSTKFGQKILKAFNYSNYRYNKLLSLAELINVKVCPYCNMHYTLYAEDMVKGKRLSRFHFDHFYDKLKYPMLSMSLFNLIPSCPVCNTGKSNKTLSLAFHPYQSNIHEQFRFVVNEPIKLAVGSIVDSIKIILEAKRASKQEVDDFQDTFHLNSLYGRHKDIVEEVYDKAYEAPFYLNPANFDFLSDKSPSYIKRLWLGTYTEKEEIEKKPMTKFIQDVWEQASDERTLTELFDY